MISIFHRILSAKSDLDVRDKEREGNKKISRCRIVNILEEDPDLTLDELKELNIDKSIVGKRHAVGMMQKEGNWMHTN